MNCLKIMKRIIATALLGTTVTVTAGNLDRVFDTDFGTLAAPTNEIFLWDNAGGATLASIRARTGSLTAANGWSVAAFTPAGSGFKLSGPGILANTGTYTIRFNFPRATPPVFSFQWAEVFWDGTFRHVLGSGSTAFSGGATGSFSSSTTFTHMADIPNLAPPPAPVPLPSSIVLLLSTLLFAPTAKLRQRKALSHA